MKKITPEQLRDWKSQGKPHLLIDVRESYEVETCSIGGLHIAMADVLNNLENIPKDLPVVFHCKSGKRSAAIVHALEQKFGYTNLYSLEGGIIAWIDTIDHSLMKY